MTKTVKDVLEVTLDWPDDARAALAEELLRTLDQRERERIEALWYAEARRRFDARDRGEMGSSPADEVFASLLKGEGVSIRILDAARDEIAEAAAYYNESDESVGDRFIRAVMATVQDIAAHPNRWTEVAPGVRRRNMSDFPYAIIYRVLGEEVEVGCVMHGHREPGYWKRRFK